MSPRAIRRVLVLVAVVVCGAVGRPAAAQVTEPEVRYQQVLETLDRQRQALGDAAAAVALATQAVAAARQAEDAAGGQLAGLQAEARRRAEQLHRARQRVAGVVAAAYVQSDGAEQAAAALGAADPTAAARQRALAASVDGARQDAVADYRRALGRTSLEARATETALSDAVRQGRRAADDLALATRRLTDAELAIDATLAQLGPGGPLAGDGVAAVTGIGDVPVVAFDAYRRAASFADAAIPTCGIQWWAVAGIARVESNHGRFRGARPDAFGHVLPAIRGIPLDGTNDTAAIPDTDGGLLDGDVVWDRAVGPLQFIPGTWRGYAARYDLDVLGAGRADPDNLYDAARATALYLCRNGGPLDRAEGLRSAFYAYNHSDAYVGAVLGHALRYAALLPTAPPASGSLPVLDGGGADTRLLPALPVSPGRRPGPTKATFRRAPPGTGPSEP